MRARNRTLRSLPPPDMPDEELDDLIDMPMVDESALYGGVREEPIEEVLEDWDRGEPVIVNPGPRPRRPQRHAEPVSRAPEGEPLGDDVEPAHIGVPRREREKAGRPSQTGRTTRVTATMRKDVEAKIRFVAVPAGRMWASSDPFCGGSFVKQEPEISSALAEIVCDSPDLLAWFTGPQGRYMKFFNLFMACVPVGMAVYGHHLAHRDEDQADPNLPPVDYTQYAA